MEQLYGEGNPNCSQFVQVQLFRDNVFLKKNVKRRKLDLRRHAPAREEC